MDIAKSCIVCRGTDLKRTAAVVAPFIRQYVLSATKVIEAPRIAALLTCGACDMTFFDARYDSNEVNALYSEYRGERYYQRRHRVEPLYTRKLNGDIGGDGDIVRQRKNVVGAFVRDLLGEVTVSSVMDFGGDAGQFIPDLPGAERYVLELSDVPPAKGVRRLGCLDDVKHPVDLMMLAHVLEHVSDPVALLEQLASITAAEGHLYVEVPLDRPMTPPAWAENWHSSWVDAVTKSTRRTVLADALSTPVRLLARQHWVPLTFPRVHEHLNFFTLASLTRALDLSGWQLVGQMEYVHRVSRLSLPALGVLAKHRPATA